jgi:HD-like signal output (HDOD) protein/CheY-like chemotaxis protein
MSLRILFVDDELKILEGLQRSVRPFRKEWDAYFANSGPEGLRLLAEKQFDVVVTDMRMPGMDGVAVLKAVMEQHPQLLRIILSGYSDMESIIKSAGVAHQYLSKPCSIEEIKSAVTRAVSLNCLLGNPELKKLLSGVNTIPSLPRLFLELTKLVNDPNSSMAQIEALVARDIGMSAKVLQLVNSAFFGRSRQIAGPAEAVRYLGLGTLKALSLAVHVFENFEGRQASASFVAELWEHSSQCGAVAEKIARTIRPGDHALHDETAMAGLLHELGRLLFACNLHEQYQQSVALADEQNIPLWKAEQQIFKASHAEAGAYIMAFWGLPRAIVEAIAYHHTPADCPVETFCALTAIHIADVLIQENDQRIACERPAELDMAYLAKVGVADRLNEFRKIVSDARARVA